MELNILDLNTDCLRHIFQYFSIYDLIELERVCTVFKATCYDAYTTRQFHKVRLEWRTLKTEYFSDIFDRLGKTLRNFEFSGGGILDKVVKRTLIDGVTKSAPKLNSLTINYTHFFSYEFIELQESFGNLVYLDLSRCGLDEELLEITLDGEKFRNIKTLKLAGNSCIKGSLFKNMINVEELDVSYCFKLKFDEFFIFLKNCIKLTYLDLSADWQLLEEVENFLDIVGNHQPHIETLIMRYMGVHEYLLDLSKFKKLKVKCFEGRRFGS